MQEQPPIAVYGATGFTGRLVARELARRGMSFAIAGRDVAKLAALGRELGRDFQSEAPQRVATLEDAASLDRTLDGVRVLINCAGPFSKYGAPVVVACIRNGVHYLDTTGEQGFIKTLQREYSVQARQRGVLLMPACAYEYAVGCFAARLAVEQGARRLGICYAQRNTRMSEGTRQSVMHVILERGYTFVEGSLVQRDLAYRAFDVPRPGARAMRAVWFPGGESIFVPLFAPGVEQVESCLAMNARVSRLLVWASGMVRPVVSRVQPLLARIGARAGAGTARGADEVDGAAAGGERPEFLVTAFDPQDSHYFVSVAGGDAYEATARIVVEAGARVLAQPPAQFGFTSPAALFEARDFLRAVSLDVVE